MNDSVFDEAYTSPEAATEKKDSISNLDFLSRMLHRDLRGYIKPYYKYLRKKFSEATLDLFVDICDKISDDLITPEVLNAVLPDMGVTDIRKDIIVKNYSLILSDKTDTLKKSTYERFREIVYREYFEMINTGSAVDTLEKIQNSDFFLPPYGVTNSDNFTQVDFGSFDMQNITEDLGSPLYSHFDEINATSPIKGYLPNQVTMVSGPPGAQTGETKVMTLDHGYKTLEELYNSGAENIEVYCVDDDCNIHVSVAERCVLTKYTTDLIKITLKSGVTLTATPEHWYRTIDGYWYEARQLKAGMSLTSFHRKVQPDLNNGVLDLFTGTSAYNNYDIISVEEYHPSEPIPVYDLLNVEKYRNFAVLLETNDGVDSGVISHNCFIGSTWVRQPDGTLDTIHNMHEKHGPNSVKTLNMETGEIYWTWKNDGCRKTRKCQEFTRIYISTRPDQPIICTHDHQFVVLDPKCGMKWVKAKDLKEGDILYSTPGIKYVRVTKTDVFAFYKEITCYDIVNNENSNYFIDAGETEEICVHNCFTGDTKVMTLDGGYTTMKELYESKAENFPVYSYNHENGEVEVQKAEKCILSKTVGVLCEITFDSDSKVTCTEDHMFPLLTGETVRADELKVGDIIMPINRKHQSLDLYKILEHKQISEDPNGYEVVYTYDDKGAGNQYTHRLVAKMMDPNYDGRCIIHHDKSLGKGKFDKSNNLPENLKVFKNQSEHMTYHKHRSWEEDYENQKRISIGNLPDSLDLTIEQVINTAISLGSPDVSDIATALGCSVSAVKSRVYSEFDTLGDFAKHCGFFPIRAESNFDISKEYLMSLGIDCHTYKVLILAKESGLPPYVIKKAIKKYFNDCHGFAHALGYTYRGKPKCNGVTIDDLRQIVSKVGPTVNMEDLMSELDISRQAVVKILEDSRLTYNEFLSTCGIISPNINYIIDKSYYYGTVNLVKLANDFNTSEENINSILENNGWTVETLTKALGRLYSNHKVTKVEIKHLNKPVPVYDIVETTHNHNFAIMLDGDKNSSSGIFACQSGKTLFMMTEAVESLLQGKKVLYAAIGDLKPFDFASRICSMLLKSPMTKTALSINSCYEAVTRLYPQVKENLAVQFISPDKYTPNQWLKMNEQLGNIDKYDVFFIDYDTNFASERDSMYAKGDEVYTMAFTLSQHKGKYVFIGSQPKIGNWKDRELGLESASESSRKQQIVDVMITLSHDRDTRNPRNHLGTINIPKNRRGGTAKFKYILDPTGVMESITDEAYVIFKDDENAISVIDSANADPTTKFVKIKHSNDTPQESLIVSETGEVIGSAVTQGIEPKKEENHEPDAVEILTNSEPEKVTTIQDSSLFDSLDGLI